MSYKLLFWIWEQCAFFPIGCNDCPPGGRQFVLPIDTRNGGRKHNFGEVTSALPTFLGYGAYKRTHGLRPRLRTKDKKNTFFLLSAGQLEVLTRNKLFASFTNNLVIVQKVSLTCHTKYPRILCRFKKFTCYFCYLWLQFAVVNCHCHSVLFDVTVVGIITYLLFV